MSHKSLQTHWDVSEYLKTAIQSQTYLVQLCAELCVGEPKGLETQTDTSDAYTRVQRAEKNLRKPTKKQNALEYPETAV